MKRQQKASNSDGWPRLSLQLRIEELRLGSWSVRTKIILTRLKAYGEEINGEYKVGFMINKSTTDQIFTEEQLGL